MVLLEIDTEGISGIELEGEWSTVACRDSMMTYHVPCRRGRHGIRISRAGLGLRSNRGSSANDDLHRDRWHGREHGHCGLTQRQLGIKHEFEEQSRRIQKQSGGARRNLSLNPSAQRSTRNFQVVMRLQIDPEFRRGAKVSSESECGIRGDSPPTKHDIIDT